MFCDILKSHTNETLVCISFQERGDFMEFGEKLKQIRIASHMSQEQLADITGLERKTIARYEMGETVPRYNKVYEKLSEFFKTSIDFWKNDNPDDFQQTAAIAYGADAKCRHKSCSMMLQDCLPEVLYLMRTKMQFSMHYRRYIGR